MKLSHMQAQKRLQKLKQQVNDLSRSTQGTISRIQKIKNTITQKKDALKANDLRKKIDLMS